MSKDYLLIKSRSHISLMNESFFLFLLQVLFSFDVDSGKRKEKANGRMISSFQTTDVSKVVMSSKTSHFLYEG